MALDFQPKKCGKLFSKNSNANISITKCHPDREGMTKSQNVACHRHLVAYTVILMYHMHGFAKITKLTHVWGYPWPRCGQISKSDMPMRFGPQYRHFDISHAWVCENHRINTRLGVPLA